MLVLHVSGLTCSTVLSTVSADMEHVMIILTELKYSARAHASSVSEEKWDRTWPLITSTHAV